MNKIIEDWVKEVADEISSVDSHLINNIGPGGTVAAQIITRAVPSLLLTTLKQQREELVKTLNDKMTVILDEYDRGVCFGLSTAIDIINHKEL